MATTQHEANIINEERSRSEEWWQEHLKPLGFAFRVAHFTGDSSYPTEYHVQHGAIGGSGPTFDMALLDCIEHLMNANARLNAVEVALQLLTGNIVNMRTDLLVIKGLVAQEDEHNGDEL